jgi:hypothetical protein
VHGDLKQLLDNLQHISNGSHRQQGHSTADQITATSGTKEFHKAKCSAIVAKEI